MSHFGSAVAQRRLESSRSLRNEGCSGSWSASQRSIKSRGDGPQGNARLRWIAWAVVDVDGASCVVFGRMVGRECVSCPSRAMLHFLSSLLVYVSWSILYRCTCAYTCTHKTHTRMHAVHMCRGTLKAVLRLGRECRDSLPNLGQIRMERKDAEGCVTGLFAGSEFTCLETERPKLGTRKKKSRGRKKRLSAKGGT